MTHLLLVPTSKDTYLDSVPDSSIVVVSICKLDKIFGLFVHQSWRIDWILKYEYTGNEELIIRQYFKLLTMNQDNSLNLSIQLQENEEKRQQEFDEFVELTQKIAESDRNNDLLREIKRNKLAEAAKIRMAYAEAMEQKQSTKERLEEVAQLLKEEKIMKIRRNQQMEELSSRFDYLSQKERKLQEQSSSLGKGNDLLQKQILKMQAEHDQLCRKNKEKDELVVKLKKRIEKEESQRKQNESKIIELEVKCQKSKNTAQSLELTLKKQQLINNKLELAIKEKEEQAKNIKRQKEDMSKRQEDIKRTNKRLKQKAKSMEAQIDRKVAEIKKLEEIHYSLQQQIEKFMESQRAYELILSKRNEIIIQMKKDCQRVKRETIE